MVLEWQWVSCPLVLVALVQLGYGVVSVWGQQAMRRLDRGLRWVSWMLDLKVFGL